MANKSKKGENILNYVYDYGFASFKEAPFLDPDSLVFSALAYIPFEKFIDVNENFKPANIQSLMIDYLSWLRPEYIKEHYPFWMKENIDLARILLKSNRYSYLKVDKMVNIFSKKDHTQFFAYRVLIDDKLAVIVYRGTDTSLLGWEENFRMTLGRIESQKLSYEFLKKSINELPDYSFITTGHSKGGHLAVVSASLLDEKRSKKIQNIYSLDGPGLPEDIFNSDGHERIKDKIILIVSKDDVVSRLFSSEKTTNICDTIIEDDLLRAHDLFNWKIKNTGFDEVKNVSALSTYITSSMNYFIKNKMTDGEERLKALEAFFSTLEKGGIKNVEVIDLPLYIFSISTTTTFVDTKEERKLLNKAMKNLASSFNKFYPQYLKDKAAEENAKKVVRKKRK